MQAHSAQSLFKHFHEWNIYSHMYINTRFDTKNWKIFLTKDGNVLQLFYRQVIKSFCCYFLERQEFDIIQSQKPIKLVLMKRKSTLYLL